LIRFLSPLPRRPGGNVWPSRPGVAAPWSPAQLSGKLLWLRADLGVTAAAGRVSSWADQSGLGNNAVSTGATSTRPLLTTWPAGNGVAALHFDGARTLATAANVLPTAANSTFTIFIVGAFDDTAARAIVRTNETSGGIALSQNVGGGLKIQRCKPGVAFDEDGAARTTPLSVIMLDMVAAVPASVMYVNGALVSTTLPGAGVLTPTGKLYIGAAVSAQFHFGPLAELLIVSGHPSVATLALITGYSVARYGV
jgi:hypothetical protein